VEVVNLLHATTLRPIAEWGRGKIEIPKSKRKGRQTWKYEFNTQQNLDACYEAALLNSRYPPQETRTSGPGTHVVYLMAVSTGLCHNELRSLTFGQLFLDAKLAPYFELYANQSKNGKESRLPLRADVVEKIRQHLEHRSKQGYKALLFDTPGFRRLLPSCGDCKERLPWPSRRQSRPPHHLWPHLAVTGVHPRVVQTAMRHSRIELTTNFYTDPALLAINGVVNAMPDWEGKQSVCELD